MCIEMGIHSENIDVLGVDIFYMVGVCKRAILHNANYKLTLQIKPRGIVYGESLRIGSLKISEQTLLLRHNSCF